MYFFKGSFLPAILLLKKKNEQKGLLDDKINNNNNYYSKTIHVSSYPHPPSLSHFPYPVIFSKVLTLAQVDAPTVLFHEADADPDQNETDPRPI